MASSSAGIGTPYHYVGEDFVVNDIPEQLRHDCLARYFRSRYNKRPDLLSSLNEEDRGRIEREECRITALRKTFEATGQNNPDMKLLTKYRAAWRYESKINAPKRLNDLEDRLSIMADRIKPRLKEDQKINRRKLERGVLQIVETWDVGTRSSGLPEQLGRIEPEASVNSRNCFSRVESKLSKTDSSEEETIASQYFDFESNKTSDRDFPPPEDDYGITVHEISLRRLSEKAHSPDTCKIYTRARPAFEEKGVAMRFKTPLDLKQHQATITNAKFALKSADESFTQGRSTFIFTVVTIIFMPLSFMASVFGMNASELSGPDGGIMSLKHQFKFIFLISFAVVMISTAIAFSTLVQSAISFTSRFLFALLFVYPSPRRAWNWAKKNSISDLLYRLAERIYNWRDRKARRLQWERATRMENYGSGRYRNENRRGMANDKLKTSKRVSGRRNGSAEEMELPSIMPAVGHLGAPPNDSGKPKVSDQVPV